MKTYFYLIVMLLTGCSAGNNIEYSKEAFNKSDLTFIGIPTILGLGASGTRFAITPHYSLTAKHVAKYTTDKVVAYHPDCDIALIKSDNTDKIMPYLSSTGVGEKVENYGYSFFTIMPVSSHGEVKSYMKLSSDENSLKCPTLYSDMGARVGMSGGPVYSNEKIVGITISYQTSFEQEGKTVQAPGALFVPFQNFKQWLITELDKTEDKGLLNIDHTRDFYDTDTGNPEEDYEKNKAYNEKLSIKK